MEIVELDQKLRDSHPTVKIPVLPINPDSIPAPPKRKSTFLNTLSRLASPTSGKSQRQSSVGRRFTNASSIPTLTSPITSPSGEISDPFTDGNVDETVARSPSAMSTAIAAYLTTVSNSATLRKDRVWKRFVRVRTDDLESVRVERAIKRVRSDLAAHVGMSKENSYSTSTSLGPGAAPSDGGSIFVEELDNSVQLDGEVLVSSRTEQEEIEEAEPIIDHAPEGEATVDATARIEDGQNDKDLAAAPVDDAATAQGHEDVPSATPVSESPISRMHRSQSADPDKSSRLTRAYTSSEVPSQDDASSQVETGDDSSISATTGRHRRRARKKRSASSAPKELKKSKRKVVIDDFEMMRVLGKGCAGKVLLVKHKSTSDLFALKAITKRHVLAHQELQHTLTEQAVLKRMAAESKDPFVVKLWWSFHDKENLFLVMVCHVTLRPIRC
jgi:serum/glucocorticoid-regulated kinase 2